MKKLALYNQVNRFAIINAMISLVVGTLFLVAFLASQEDGLIGIGFYYLGIAFYWNLTVLVVVLANMIYRKIWKESLLTVGLMLVNIPIAYLYFLIVIKFV